MAEEAGAHPDLKPTFAHWRPPWFYLPDEQAYQALFEAQGLRTVHCQIEREEKLFDLKQALAVFASGAAQGYTGAAFYDVPIDEAYVSRFNACARQAMERRAKDSQVLVDFRRLYYVGVRE